MTDLPIFPAIPLSRKQAHGFRLACACMSDLGRQMAEAPVLADCDDGNTRAAGTIMGILARALATQLAGRRPDEALLVSPRDMPVRPVSLPVMPI